MIYEFGCQLLAFKGRQHLVNCWYNCSYLPACRSDASFIFIIVGEKGSSTDLYHHLPLSPIYHHPLFWLVTLTHSPFQQLSSFDEPFPIFLFILVVSLSKKFDIKMIQKRVEKRSSLKVRVITNISKLMSKNFILLLLEFFNSWIVIFRCGLYIPEQLCV